MLNNKIIRMDFVRENKVAILRFGRRGYAWKTYAVPEENKTKFISWVWNISEGHCISYPYCGHNTLFNNAILLIKDKK